jgi:hypothetical protein
MAPHNEEDDPAVYRSGNSKSKKSQSASPHPPAMTTNGTKGKGTNGKSTAKPAAASTTKPEPMDIESAPRTSSPAAPQERSSASDTEMHNPEEDPENNPEGEMVDGVNDDEEEESTLLTVQPGFNRLLLVLRDEKVMRFVKYISAAAEGSRWDVCGEYEVGMVQEEEEEEEEEGVAANDQ